MILIAYEIVLPTNIPFLLPPSKGLQMVHENPYIFIVNNFLKPHECDLLLAKVSEVGGRKVVGALN